MPHHHHRKTSPKKPQIVHFEDAPPWLQDNVYLTSGYRSNYGFFHSLGSLFHLHNEWVNMWSHLLGFILFVFLAYYTYTHKFPSRMTEVFSDLHDGLHSVEDFAVRIRDDLSSKLPDLPHFADLPEKIKEIQIASHDFWKSVDWANVGQKVDDSILAVFPFLDSGNHTLSITPIMNRLWTMHRDYSIHQGMFGIFFGGAMMCLFFSFVFHTFMGVSSKWCLILSKLDYACISIMIAASSTPAVFYGHYCNTFWQIFWLSFIGLFCIGGVIVSMVDKFSDPEWRPFRAGMFVGIGLSGVFPLVHHFFDKKEVFHESTASLTIYLLIMGGLYVLGAFLFATRIPERFFPGKCNIWFHSHQLHHFCVVAAAYMHYRGLLSSFDYRMANPCNTL